MTFPTEATARTAKENQEGPLKPCIWHNDLAHHIKKQGFGIRSLKNYTGLENQLNRIQTGQTASPIVKKHEAEGAVNNICGNIFFGHANYSSLG